ncbi:MAG TPA: hypothetical protein VIL93_00250, partial [Solirubrobacterales bacterium]
AHTGRRAERLGAATRPGPPEASHATQLGSIVGYGQADDIRIADQINGQRLRPLLFTAISQELER